MTLKELREKGKAAAAAVRQQADRMTAEGYTATAEDQETWKKVNADYDAIKAKIDVAQRADEIDASLAERADDRRIGREDYDGRSVRAAGDGAETAVTEEQRALALQAWCRVQMGEDLGKRHLRACKAVGLNPGRKKLNIQLYRTSDLRALTRRFRSVHPTQAVEHCGDFKAAMSGQSGPAGGYLIPPETLIRSLEVNMLAHGGVRQVAETLVTSTGERMSWPTADDSSNVGEQLGESTSVGSSVEPAFGKVFWDAYKFSSKPILVPFELLEDSAFEIVSVLGEMMGERIGRITNTRQTTGSGAGTCKGLVTCSAFGLTAASASAIAADEIIRLEHSVDPAYRNGAGYMLNDATLVALRLLKTGTGAFLWQTGFNDGTPDRLNNRPVTVNQDMASIGASAKSVLFGNFSRYKIRRVGVVRMYRMEERYRDQDQDGFVAFVREDANLLSAGTAPVKHLVHP